MKNTCSILCGRKGRSFSPGKVKAFPKVAFDSDIMNDTNTFHRPSHHIPCRAFER